VFSSQLPHDPNRSLRRVIRDFHIVALREKGQVGSRLGGWARHPLNHLSTSHETNDSDCTSFLCSRYIWTKRLSPPLLKCRCSALQSTWYGFSTQGSEKACERGYKQFWPSQLRQGDLLRWLDDSSSAPSHQNLIMQLLDVALYD
jgi:hypothetical protein